MLFVIVFVIAVSGVDAFGQLFRRNNTQLIRPVVRESLKAEIILMSHPSIPTSPEWKLGVTQGGRPPVGRALESPFKPGTPPLAGARTIIAWEFGEMSASPASRATTFKYTFEDSEGIEQGGEFTFYPREGKIRFENNESVGWNWEFDDEASSNLAPTQTIYVPPRNRVIGAGTIEEWTLGKILDGKSEGTAVFTFDYREQGHTGVVIKLRK